MVVGFHDLFDSLARYADGVLTSDKGLSLLLMDGLLLIPLVFMAFFYPAATLVGVAAVAALTTVALVLLRAWHHRADAGGSAPRS